MYEIFLNSHVLVKESKSCMRADESLQVRVCIRVFSTLISWPDEMPLECCAGSIPSVARNIFSLSGVDNWKFNFDACSIMRVKRELKGKG